MTRLNETRAEVIWRHVHEHLRNTATSWPSFAAEVRAAYEQRTPAQLRRLEFSTHRDAHTRMRLDAQTLRRFETDVRFGLPSELEEAMVVALPEHHQRVLLSELAQRYGLLAAPIPEGEQNTGIRNAAALAREFGSAYEVLGRMLEDGRIDEADRPLARQATQRLLEVQARVTTTLQEINAILPDTPLKAVK